MVCSHPRRPEVERLTGYNRSSVVERYQKMYTIVSHLLTSPQKLFSGSAWPGGKGFGLALSSLIRSSTSGVTCDAMRATVAALSSDPSAGDDGAAATADGAVVTGDGVGTGAVL